MNVDLRIAPGSYVGPVSQNKKRAEGEKFPLKDNLTPSLQNAVLPYADLSVKTLKCPAVVVPSTNEFKPLPFLKQQKDLLKLALMKRVASIYHQLILTYGSRHTYAIGSTEDQAQSAVARSVKDKKVTLRIPLHATHNAVIPNLKIVDWDTEEEDFVKGSHIQRGWNSTIELPEGFNLRVDIGIDNKLRPLHLEVINRNAQEEISPEAGFVEVIEGFIKIVEANLAKTTHDEDRFGLGVYLKQLRKVEEKANNFPKFFDTLMGIWIYEEEDEATQTFLYNKRTVQIRENCFRESEIIAKIEAAKETVLSGLEKQNHAEEAFYLVLQESLKEHGLKIHKLLNRVPRLEKPRAKQSRTEKTRETQLDNAISAIKTKKVCKDAIAALARDLTRFFSSTKKQENQAVVLKELRALRGFTQEAFCEAYNEQFSNTPITLKKYQKYEHRHESPTFEIIARIGKVLNIDPTFLHPQFFDD